MHLLSGPEKKRLSRYNSQFRNMLDHMAPKHNCYGKKRRPIKKKDQPIFVTMELKAKEEPKEYDEFSNSAHQFSVRDKSLQCDSHEVLENEMQTSVVSKKSDGMQVDVYDLKGIRDQGTGEEPQEPIGMFREKKSIGVATESTKRFLCS